MPKHRVLVVDDSVVIRRLLCELLERDPAIDVVGTASNGRIALEKIPHLNPDFVTLDVEMPEMDGLETLRRIRRTHPRLPVVMFSTLTDQGAQVTCEALAAGASDYVAKPSNVGSVTEAIRRVSAELIPKIHTLCGASDPPRRPVKRPRGTARGAGRPEIIVIAASTGGPDALARVLEPLPRTFSIPIAIVQHIPPLFTEHLARRLNQICKVEVVEASDQIEMTPGRAVLARGDRHLELKRQATRLVGRLTEGPPENSCRPAADVLFRSAARVFGAGCLAVVLTGMGRDGALGCEIVAEAGGRVVAQDEATSVVWGMPRAVVEAGHADQVMSLNDISGEMQRSVNRPSPGGPRRLERI